MNMQSPNDMIKIIGNYSYEINKCLGEGAFGKVYEGMSRLNGQKVAIKKLDLRQIEGNEYLKKAINTEISILKKFKHENIVEFIDFLASKNSLYLVMEFCQQGDLKRYLRKNPSLGEKQLQDILKQIIKGFSELNRHKVTHRDLKPANILVSNNIFKIADFGFAKYVNNFPNQLLKSLVGSPIYMSPQILSKQAYTTKSDIWSLGVLAFEMFYKQVPWNGNSQEHLLNNIKSQPLKEREGATFKLIRRMLEYEEEKRIEWDELFTWAGLNPQQINQMPSQQISQPASIQPSIPSTLQQPSVNPSVQQASQRPSSPQPTSPKPQNKSHSPARQKDTTLQQTYVINFVTVDLFSKIRRIRKVCEDNSILDRIAYLLCRILVKRTQSSNNKLQQTVKQLTNDINDYLNRHKVYNSLKSEFIHYYKEEDLMNAVRAELEALKMSSAYPILQLELSKVMKLVREPREQKLTLQEMLHDLRALEG